MIDAQTTELVNAIAIVESDGRQDAVGDNGRAISMFQIHEGFWLDVYNWQQKKHGRQVVDIGCSRAEEIGNLYTPEQYVGLDCSPALIACARAAWPGYRFGVCAAQDITGRYPVGIMKAVLEHVPPKEAVEIYEHVRRHVGVLYLCWH